MFHTEGRLDEEVTLEELPEQILVLHQMRTRTTAPITRTTPVSHVIESVSIYSQEGTLLGRDECLMVALLIEFVR